MRAQPMELLNTDRLAIKLNNNGDSFNSGNSFFTVQLLSSLALCSL